jgi:plasmid maintenance system antidote protein VapI
MIEIGELIRAKLHEQGKTVVWLARQLSCSRNNVYKIFHNNSIATQELMRISKIMEYDFFALYSQELQQSRSRDSGQECNQSDDMSTDRLRS